ncbi:CoA-binding protein [Amphibacillus sp. Q70]|uniref:CoA-binding protein n=1 Tax=Amphibacillus sp. Q70 TaxID=3453416 RepID=UPI003F82D479
MKEYHPNQTTLKKIFDEAKTIAVVGLSDKPERTSYQISELMQGYGFKIIPVNPKVDQVLGEKAYPSLTAIPEPVDIVNVFRRSEFLKEIAAETKEIKAKVLWAQQGVYDEEVYQEYHDDFDIVMDLCIKVAYSTLK